MDRQTQYTHGRVIQRLSVLPIPCRAFQLFAAATHRTLRSATVSLAFVLLAGGGGLASAAPEPASPLLEYFHFLFRTIADPYQNEAVLTQRENTFAKQLRLTKEQKHMLRRLVLEYRLAAADFARRWHDNGTAKGWKNMDTDPIAQLIEAQHKALILHLGNRLIAELGPETAKRLPLPTTQ